MQNQIEACLHALRLYYEESGRHDMLWRQTESDGSFDPYKIMVSELMLQQTQVSRVTPKFEAFINRFPSVQSLASAELGEVLVMWQGLGYNRRAKFLWQAAKVVAHSKNGVFPDTIAGLTELPGVGPNTAGAIAAYAYDQPVQYLETNIRTVLIHHFYDDQSSVADTDLKNVLAELINYNDDQKLLSPRQFYWAMMDYGAFLKKSVGNLNRNSKSFVKQSTFHGSKRQLRGSVIRLLSERDYARSELLELLNDERSEAVLADLLAENLIQNQADRFYI